MPYLREVFPKADIVGCGPSAESLVMARRENPSCRFMSMDELGDRGKVRPSDRLLGLSTHSAAGSADGHSLLLKPPEGMRTLRHLRAQSDQSGHTSSGQELTLRRGSAEHGRDGRTHAQHAPAYVVELLPVPPAAARRASPFEKYLRWLPMGGQFFVCASNQKAGCRLTAAFVSRLDVQARPGMF